MAFTILLMVLGLVSELIKSKSYLRFKLGNNEIQFNELSYSSASTLDTHKYYINSEFGFAFYKPNNDWSKVASGKGTHDLYELMALKSTTFTEESIVKNLKRNPLGNMISKATLYYYVHPGSKTDIIITDSTTNDQITEQVSQYKEDLLTRYSLTLATLSPLQKQRLDSLVNKYRRDLIDLDSFEGKESFLLMVFPKSELPAYLKNLKLPAFYSYLSDIFGLNADKLVANERQIIVGAEYKIDNVLANKKLINFQSKKLVMFTENENYFFDIELTYSPQISPSTKLWDDLQEGFNSFTLLSEDN